MEPSDVEATKKDESVNDEQEKQLEINYLAEGAD